MITKWVTSHLGAAGYTLFILGSQANRNPLKEAILILA